MNYSHRNGRRGAGSPFLRVLITIASLAVVSLGAAFFWQNTEDSVIASAASSASVESSSAPENPEASDNSSGGSEYADIELDDDALGSIAPSSVPETESSASENESSSSQESGVVPSQYAREAVPGSVPSSKPVGYGYFDDAIFFGDSISVGIPLYMQTTVPNAAVVAAQGVSPGGALTSQSISSGGNRVTMLEAARAKGDRGKVYIMLGANALDYDEDAFINGYAEFLRAVKAEYPEAVIYVQSMLPVTVNVNNVYPSKNINNERISAYNKAICKMALDSGVYYVDVAQGIADENGMLPNEASPLDGMHLSAEYYMKWFDYLRSHTVNLEK